MKILQLISLVLIFGFVSCKKENIEGKVKTDPSLALELSESPESLSIGNINLTLNAYLSRDFMPVAEENGSKMRCINKLTEVSGIAISNSIQLKKQYVIKDNEIWTADYSEIKTNLEFIIEGFVEDGPKWGPDIEVDVVCEFETNGITYRIMAKSQNIDKTS